MLRKCTEKESVTYVEELNVFGRHFLPRLFEARHGAVTQTGDNGKHRVEVLAVLAVT